MRIGTVRLSGVSIAVLAIQLAIVSSIATKFLYQRWRCPRVWTRAVAYDPELLMRGRYLSLQLVVDGCESTLPSHKEAEFPRNVDGTVKSPRFRVEGVGSVQFQAKLAVEKNRLVALRLPEPDGSRDGQLVSVDAGRACEDMFLVSPVNFYIAEKAQSPLSSTRADELWIEVTVPPKGPPRPIQLALKHEGAWKPLAFR
jgi:hypothetical protein